MYIVSVTRLRIRKWRYLLPFLYLTLLSQRQARRAQGNLSSSVKHDAHLVFWTITLWHDEHSMRAFRNHGAHMRAMPRLRDWCDEATYVHWEQDERAEAPDLSAAFEHLAREGIVSRVKHPSPEHVSREFPAPKSVSHDLATSRPPR